jgi:hypothetical protein
MQSTFKTMKSILLPNVQTFDYRYLKSKIIGHSTNSDDSYNGYNHILPVSSISILTLCTYTQRSRVSSGSIVSDYGLDDRAIGVRYPAGAKDFSCSLCVQTGSGVHSASCTGGPFPGGKSAAGA